MKIGSFERPHFPHLWAARECGQLSATCKSSIGGPFSFRLWCSGFLHVRFATCLAFKGVQIRQSAKLQSFPNELHRPSAFKCTAAG